MLSAHLQCVNCYAAFDYFGESSGLVDHVCTFCGSDLIELPDAASSDLVGCGLHVVRPPFGEIGIQSAKQRDPVPMPRLEREDSVAIRRQDLAALAGDVDLHVEAWPIGRNKSPTIGWWGASLLELDVYHSDFSLDATLVGLTNRVSTRVTQLIGLDDERRKSHLPLLLTLWLEDQTGRLGTFLESATVLTNWEYDRDAC